MKFALLFLSLLFLPFSQASAQQQARLASATPEDPGQVSRLSQLLPTLPTLPTYERDANPALGDKQPMIQLALLLDTSSSMGGLIRQAKSQLWSMVNAFVNVKKNGVHPKFQVALYEYGSNQLTDYRGNVRQIVPLTDNLDEVSEKLMALEASTRSGSEEQCGWVLHQAIEELGWSASADDLKVICIAGNESFSQGLVDWRIPCKLAGDASIGINTIYCGGYDQGEQLGWKTAAQLGGGSYAAIDHNVVRHIIESPQDAELTALNAQLNATYVPYSESGIAAQQRQQIADAAAQDLAQSSLSERANLKATRFYKTDDWDLVAAAQDDSFELDSVPEESLPEVMQKMSAEQKRLHLAQLANQREDIKKKILAVSAARAKYLETVEQNSAQTLDRAVVDSLKSQALKKKFVEP